jgi:hypothetical protein
MKKLGNAVVEVMMGFAIIAVLVLILGGLFDLVESAMRLGVERFCS